MTVQSVGPVKLVDMIFPGDTNHHGTLFGGVALAHMDKVAFLAASRHGRAPFVTASSERIDFSAPALKGEIVEATGRIIRVGNSSCDVEVELVAESLLKGERQLCTRGLFTLVAMKGPDTRLPLPPLPVSQPEPESGNLHMMDMVFPPQTNHYQTLFGGDALALLGKAAFIASTRHTRSVMVMAASEKVNFREPVAEGDLIELIAKIDKTGISSVRVKVEMWSENLLTAKRIQAVSSEFIMVSVDKKGHPKPISKSL